MQMLRRISDVPFELHFLVMDPGYAPANRQRIQDNAALLGIPIEILESNIFAVSERMDERKPCYLCAKMRRGWLYHHAQAMGCNKIALGHHFSDVIETTLMGMSLRRPDSGHAPQTPQQPFPRNGVDPPAVLRPRRRYHFLEAIQPSGIPAMCLLLYRTLRLRRKRLQARRDETVDPNTEGRLSPAGKRTFSMPSTM